MKILSFTLLIYFPFILFDSLDKKRAVKEDLNISYQNNIIIEHFTSEGCSSCPPAERLLKQFQNNDSIIVLSFHVDYWDHLGWKDVFASPKNTQRQRNYAKVLKQESIYTPEAVINGKFGIVGSDNRKLFAAINKEEKNISPYKFQSTTSLVENSSIVHVEYSVDGHLQDIIINYAIVENEVTSKITNGENAGLIMNHINVIRIFESDLLKSKSGKKDLLIPKTLNNSNLKCIVYLQNKNTLEIYSANQTKLY